jgi:hypothetical protein
MANKYGDSDRLSLLTNLKEAHDAFIFGTTSAALILMRSVLEAVLRDHYRAEGKDLSERINNAVGLPRAANAAALHRLRKIANKIAHLNENNNEFMPDLNKINIEKEIVLLLFVLRHLIENTK